MPTRAAWAQGTELQQQWNDYRKGQEAYDRGVAAQRRGDSVEAAAAFDTADGRFRRVLQLNPQRTDIYALLGDILIRRGQAAAAYVLLNKQVREGVTEPQVRWQLARALHGIHQERRALQLAQQLVEALPGDLRVWAFIGERAAELGEDAVAIPALRRVISPAGRRPVADLGPEADARLSRHLARCLSRTGHGDEAVALLEAAVARAPRDVAARRALAEVLCDGPVGPAQKTQIERGLALLAELAREQPGDAEVALLRGRTLLREGRAPEAIAELRRHVALRPAGEGQDGLLWLARALRAGGRPADAVEILGKAAPGPEVFVELGRDYLALRPPNLVAAGQSLGRATAAAPGDVPACQEHAAVLSRLGQATPALVEARRCVGLMPQDPVTLWLRGALALEVRQLDEATTALRAARAAATARAVRAGGAGVLTPVLRELVLAPQMLALGKGWPGGETADLDPVLRGTLAHALLRQGLLQVQAAGLSRAAIAPLREAHELAPLPVCARALAVALLGNGGADEAARLLRPLAEAAAPEPTALLAYGRALREAGRLDEAGRALRRAQDRMANLPRDVALLGAARMELALLALAARRPAEACALLAGAGGAEGEAQERLLAQASLAAARQALADEAAPSPLGFLQTVARLRPRLTEPERAEGEVLYVQALLRAGQADAALRRLPVVEGEFAPGILQGVLGPGGFEELTARVALRAGQLQQGVTAAQRAITALPPAEGQRLRALLAGALVSRAITAFERSDYERAYNLLRAPVVQAEARQRGAAGAIVDYDLGTVLMARGKRDEAAALWGKIDPKDLPERWLALGTHAESGGDRRAALEHYRRYLGLVSEGQTTERVRRWVAVLERIYAGERRPGGEPGSAQVGTGDARVDLPHAARRPVRRAAVAPGEVSR